MNDYSIWNIHIKFILTFGASQVVLVVKNIPGNATDIRDKSSASFPVLVSVLPATFHLQQKQMPAVSFRGRDGVVLVTRAVQERYRTNIWTTHSIGKSQAYK